jgi:hypothetical protein
MNGVIPVKNVASANVGLKAICAFELFELVLYYLKRREKAFIHKHKPLNWSSKIKPGSSDNVFELITELIGTDSSAVNLKF